MYVNIPVEIWQVVRDDLDDRHPLLREIEALEARLFLGLWRGLRPRPAARGSGCISI